MCAIRHMTDMTDMTHSSSQHEFDADIALHLHTNYCPAVQVECTAPRSVASDAPQWILTNIFVHGEADIFELERAIMDTTLAVLLHHHAERWCVLFPDDEQVLFRAAAAV